MPARADVLMTSLALVNVKREDKKHLNKVVLASC